MKLLRYGPRGHEKPGLIDRNGQIRDLSGAVGDINGDALSPASLDRLRRLDPATLPLVSGSARLGPCVGSVSKIVAIGLNYRLHAEEAGAPIPDNVVEKARSVIDAHRSGFRKTVQAGVRIAMGTDSGVVPHGQNLRELALMVEGGMTPAAALEATTRSAAQLMGLDADLGTIEPGKLADLVVVSGDPYDFATLGERVEAVWKAGARVV